LERLAVRDERPSLEVRRRLAEELQLYVSHIIFVVVYIGSLFMPGSCESSLSGFKTDADRRTPRSFEGSPPPLNHSKTWTRQARRGNHAFDSPSRTPTSTSSTSARLLTRRRRTSGSISLRLRQCDTIRRRRSFAKGLLQRKGL